MAKYRYEVSYTLVKDGFTTNQIREYREATSAADLEMQYRAMYGDQLDGLTILGSRASDYGRSTSDAIDRFVEQSRQGRNSDGNARRDAHVEDFSFGRYEPYSGHYTTPTDKQLCKIGWGNVRNGIFCVAVHIALVVILVKLGFALSVFGFGLPFAIQILLLNIGVFSGMLATDSFMMLYRGTPIFKSCDYDIPKFVPAFVVLFPLISFGIHLINELVIFALTLI